MKITITAVLLLLNTTLLAFPVPIFDEEFNTNECWFKNQNDLGVCIYNNTGETLSEKHLSLNEAISRPGSGAVTHLTNYIFKSGTYLNIHTSKKRLEKGDYVNGENKLTGSFYINAFGEKREWEIPSCTVVWSYQTPPYPNPVVLILEKINNSYQCRYQ